jgi:hypothetical protein
LGRNGSSWFDFDQVSETMQRQRHLVADDKHSGPGEPA